MNIEEIVKSLIDNLDFVNILWQISTPIIFSVADVITGVLQAVINKNLDSQVMRNGLIHKALVILILVLSFIIQYAFNLPIISKVVCIYILVMELISIIENLKKAGINIIGIANLIKDKPENSTNDNLNKLINTIDEKVQEVNSEDVK